MSWTAFPVTIAFILFFSKSQAARYEITVSTVDEFLAGTDARVFIEMYGGNAEKTGWIELTDDGKNVFEAGANDTFYRDARFIKPIKFIKMMRNNDWYTPGWKLLKVTIRIQGHSDLYTFYFNKWLRANEEVTLHEENKCRSGHSDCHHLCIYTNPGYRCDCRPGFELHRMNRCKDVDECKNGDNKCDLKAAHCVNKPGSYSCQCKEGYQQMDNYTCTAFTSCNVLTLTGLQTPLSKTFLLCSAKMCSESDALGMESGKIKNQSITASSYYPQYPPWAARLRSGISKGWYAFPYDSLPWIQVDLGKQTWLKGVATQGKMFSMYVTSYKLAYSQDQVTWFYYRGDSDNDKVLNGNKDPYRVVTNSLPRPIHTRFVRLYPLSWNDALVMKLELYGCISS